MNLSPTLYAELQDLFERVCHETATAADLTRLDELVCQNPDARAFYVDYMDMHVQLRWSLASDDAAETEGQPGATSKSPPRSPVLGFLGDVMHGNFHLPGSTPILWTFVALATSVLLTLVVLSAIAIRGIHVHVDGPQVAADLPSPSGRGAGGDGDVSPSPTLPLAPSLTSSPLAHLARLAECVWTDDANAAKLNEELDSGRRLSLKSGMVEIVYQSGAKVLLQGPAEFAVRSGTSGDLERGKLAVTVEEPEARGFEIHTSGMKFTDLGTEFGVFVADDGVQELDVFRGHVRAEAEAAGTTPNSELSTQNSVLSTQSPLVLSADQAIRVEKQQGKASVVVTRQAARPDQFVRQMPPIAGQKSAATELDLVDVAAGGDGFSGHRNRAIDAGNGRFKDEPEADAKATLHGKHVPFQADHQYHRVLSAPLIDGVFTLPGDGEPAQLDSAGHRYAGFPHTKGETPDPIRAIGATASGPAVLGSSKEQYWLPKFGGAKYTSLGHDMLYMRGKKGITFDLGGLRRAHPQYRLLTFTAVAGNPVTPISGQGFYADFWVFVDGQLRFQRRHVAAAEGEITISIALKPADHFLTLATSPSGDGVRGEMPLYCDPRLILAAAEKTQNK